MGFEPRSLLWQMKVGVGTAMPSIAHWRMSKTMKSVELMHADLSRMSASRWPNGGLTNWIV